MLISMRVFAVFVLLLSSFMVVVAQDDGESLTIYSGRNENLIAPLLEQFTQDTGIQVNVLYGSTSAVANQIIEEGANSPADVYIAQDGGALGALAQAGLLAPLPADVMERATVEAFSSPDNLWVGLSGRARVLVYNTELVEELGLTLPDSIADLVNEEYRGLVGWAPTNASLQANVTAMRVLWGDEATMAWLKGMVDNDAVALTNNGAIHRAVIAGEIPMGLTNHYYLFNFLRETPDAPIALHNFSDGDVGSLINVSGAAILATSNKQGLAQRLLLYLLSNGAQQYYADNTFEYPVIDGVTVNELLTPLSEISAPAIDLSDLADLQATLDMIEESGALDN